MVPGFRPPLNLAPGPADPSPAPRASSGSTLEGYDRRPRRRPRTPKKQDHPMASMIDTSQFRNGIKVILDGNPFTMVYFQHVKPGKGGAFVRTKVKNLLNGRTIERTFRSGERIEEADIQEKSMQYLYQEGENLVFMDQQTYDQIPIPPDVIGDAIQFMLENMEVDVLFWNGKPVNIELPNYIVARVVKSDPGLKGDTSSGATKPATLECGATIQVPLFIKEGDMLRVDTRTGEYSERVNQ
jgi:elongation factor P